MKTKKIFLITSLLILITGLGACKDSENEFKPQFEIYENHDISACGIDDPLMNLEWLIETCIKYGGNNYNSFLEIRIELYANIETQEEYIVLFFFPSPNPKGECVPMDPHFLKQVYTCSGDMFPFDSDIDWNLFFYSGKNKSQGIIWYRNRIK